MKIGDGFPGSDITTYRHFRYRATMKESDKQASGFGIENSGNQYAGAHTSAFELAQMIDDMVTALVKRNQNKENSNEQSGAAHAIRKERQMYEEDEDVLHNRMIDKRIIQMWKQEYPQEVARLEQMQSTGLHLAFAARGECGERCRSIRMGNESADAREQAELQHYQLISPQD